MPFDRARLLRRLGRYREAAQDYLSSVTEDLERGNHFSAAFYLRELVECGLIQELYLLALSDAQQQGELWWQIRCLEDLEWDQERRELVLKHAEEIDASSDLLLKEQLAWARRSEDDYIAAKKEIAKAGRSVYFRVDNDTTQDPSEASDPEQLDR